MYWHIQDLWGPANFVASCVTETEAILPYLTGVHQDSAWATHGCPSRYYVEDVYYGEVGSDHLLDHIMNCGHSWCPPVSRVSCYLVYTLTRLTIDYNLHDTLGNG
jgi:hypothetical protein